MRNNQKEYKSSLIFVSHDRYFVTKIADSIVAFEQEGVIYFKGNYDEYCKYKDNINVENISEKKIDDKEKKTNNQYFKDKENARRKNRIKKLEIEIEEGENKIKLLKLEMEDTNNCTDYMKLKELQEKIQEIEQEIENKMLEWEELNGNLED